MAADDYPILFLTDVAEGIGYTRPGTVVNSKGIPQRDRQSHADLLIARLDTAWRTAEANQVAVHSNRTGIYLEFAGAQGYDLNTRSLEARSSGIRLMNVRTIGEGAERIQCATLYVPKNKAGHFLKKIRAYKEEDASSDPEKAMPKNQPLVASIEDVRVALLRAFWTDDPSKMPQEEAQWLEVWLAVEADATRSVDRLKRFHEAVAELGILAGKPTQLLKFPERWVVLVFANRAQLLSLIDHADLVGEFRAAREPCTYFVNEAANSEQAEWVKGLLERTRFNRGSNIAICILDRGINSRHPMIAPALAEEDMHTVDAGWGTHDHHRQGHGTRMAGVALYGDVQGAIESRSTIDVLHRLESAKMLPPDGQQNRQDLWGARTAQAIYLAEIQAPHRHRIVCMAVTAENTRDRGRPTSWSAELDQLAAGSDDSDAGDSGKRRLILVSAGNINDPDEWKNYPDSNFTNEIHDPAQSWNSLSVGAFTNLTNITHPEYAGYSPIARLGGLSPYSSTSITWPSRWPVKPDIVLEGGNAAISPGGAAEDIDDLQVLSTYHRLDTAHFAVFGQTSAATAHAGYLAARIYSEYPDLWPETVRGLLVHSARWTEAMEAMFKTGTGKSAYRPLLRSCGYGIPNIELALRCLSNRLTLVSEAQLQPFDSRDGRYVTKDLHLYELPWPAAELRQLGGIEVKLRITLSYFIEPGPGEVGWKDRYRYASHGLRFELNNANETREEFLKRVNKLARDEDEGAPDTSAPTEHWLLGSQQRDTGSIHSDLWTGTAADLANSNLIAIRPSVGWWRERAHLGRWNRLARYSLIVSIETPETAVDIYTRVANEIATSIAVPVEIEIGTVASYSWDGEQD